MSIEKKKFSVINNDNPLTNHIKKVKKSLKIVFIFSMCINMLMLITPLYSLQVLDRVIGSGNKNTLLMLSLIIGFIYLISAFLQVSRSFTLIKIGDWLDFNISPLLFKKIIESSVLVKSLNSGQLMRDFQTVKMFLTSIAINTIFDAPWTIPYMIVLYLIHPYMFIIAAIGAILIISFALLNTLATSNLLKKSSYHLQKSIGIMEMSSSNAEVIDAMGMINNVQKLWFFENRIALNEQCLSSYRNGIISNISSFIRSIIQMSVTGFGAFVVINSSGADMTTGGMIASSIIVGKALMPFNNFIGLWKNINEAKKSYERMNTVLNIPNQRNNTLPIPITRGIVLVEKLFFHYPISTQNKEIKYILSDVSFAAYPGEILVIIGNSASGKSTISKLLTGIYKPSYGTVRLDSNEVYYWNREAFGKGVGYLPQNIDLFNGSIAQNVARMNTSFEPKMVLNATKETAAHEMISKFPGGYDFDIGISGSKLSGGQKQRIALARAFFGDPKLIILDEPNANLDTEGEEALKLSLVNAKKKNKTIILISHRSSILSIADKILLMQNGRVASYGSSEEVLEKMIVDKN